MLTVARLQELTCVLELKNGLNPEWVPNEIVEQLKKVITESFERRVKSVSALLKSLTEVDCGEKQEIIQLLRTLQEEDYKKIAHLSQLIDDHLKRLVGHPDVVILALKSIIYEDVSVPEALQESVENFKEIYNDPDGLSYVALGDREGFQSLAKEIIENKIAELQRLSPEDRTKLFHEQQQQEKYGNGMRRRLKLSTDAVELKQSLGLGTIGFLANVPTLTHEQIVAEIVQNGDKAAKAECP